MRDGHGGQRVEREMGGGGVRAHSRSSGTATASGRVG